jgi:hypothetical protein
VLVGDKQCGLYAQTLKFPVKFPVSREFAREKLAPDCLLRHTVWSGRNPLVFPSKSREIPANSPGFIVKPGQRKSFVLALHLDTLPVFSDPQASSPVSSIPVGE